MKANIVLLCLAAAVVLGVLACLSATATLLKGDFDVLLASSLSALVAAFFIEHWPA